jgi:predicted DNA-binding protein
MDDETKERLEVLCKSLARQKTEELLDKKIRDLIKSEIKRGQIK